MNYLKNNRFGDFESLNCEACGHEYIRAELESVKLAGFKSVIRICASCKSKQPQDHYESAANTLKAIAATVNGKLSPEERIQKIKELLDNGDI